jgi:transcriptional regulator with XRE-family HTH domain
MLLATVEALGPKIRRQRRRLGLTQDELAARAKISKPYLSLIETGRVANPPSDEKLRKLEQSLGLSAGDLLSVAYYQRTPRDARAKLMELTAAGLAMRPTRAAVVRTSSAHATELKLGATPLTDWIAWPDVPDKNAYAARVCDDSMSPLYRPGEIVIFSPTLTAADGDDCFVSLADGRTTFHRTFFEKSVSGEPAVRLQPRNEKYRPILVPAEQIMAMHKAVYKYQRADEA